MKSEWLLFFLMLVGAASLLLRKGPAGYRSLIPLASVLGSVAIAATIWHLVIPPRAESEARLLKSTPHEGGPDGYVSSDNCRSCHPSQYASWHQTFHRTMTQLARPEAVVGDFNHVQLELRGKTYLIDRRGEEFW